VTATLIRSGTKTKLNPCYIRPAITLTENAYLYYQNQKNEVAIMYTPCKERDEISCFL